MADVRALWQSWDVPSKLSVQLYARHVFCGVRSFHCADYTYKMWSFVKAKQPAVTCWQGIHRMGPWHQSNAEAYCQIQISTHFYSAASTGRSFWLRLLDSRCINDSEMPFSRDALRPCAHHNISISKDILQPK